MPVYNQTHGICNSLSHLTSFFIKESLLFNNHFDNYCIPYTTLIQTTLTIGNY